MRSTRVRRRVAAVLGTAGLLAGCEKNPFVVSQDQAARQGTCTWMTSTPAPGAKRSVFLLDRSASTRASGTTTAGAPDYPEALKAAVNAAVDDGHVVTIGIAGGGASTVTWIVEDRITDAGHNNPDRQAEDHGIAKKCLHEELQKAGRSTPTAAGSDPRGGLLAGAEHLKDTGGTGKVVFATDGLPTTGCADLTLAWIGSAATMDEIVRRCAPTGDSPELTGIAVDLVGIGHPAPDRPQPATSHLTWLKQLWQRLCQQAYGPCQVSIDAVAGSASADNRPTKSTADTGVAAAPADPVLRFPATDEGVKDADGSIRFALDSLVLFDRNSAVISPDGLRTLAKVATRISTIPNVSITVDGYTQADSTPAANHALASRRALAVASVLRGHGVSQVTSQGHPGTAPNCPPEYPRGRQHPADPSAQQCNRRVDIVASPPRR